MQAVNIAGVTLAIAGLALGGFVVVAALVELATGKPLRRRLSGPGRRATALSALCTGLGICIIDLTGAIGWNANDPAIMLAIFGPAIFILMGLAVYFAGKARQQGADSSAHQGAVRGTSHGT
jgi:hypothetical protein